MPGQRKARHRIGGEWHEIGAETPSINSADGSAIGSYFDSGSAAATTAIDAAFKAFHVTSWRGDGIGRATALSHLADVFAARLDELVETLCLENGKFKGEASYEIAHIVRSLRFTAGLATQVFARVLDPVPGKQSMSTRQPMGVAGLMIPWKLPGLPADPGARPVHGVGVRVRRQAVRPGGADRRGAGGLLHGGA